MTLPSVTQLPVTLLLLLLFFGSLTSAPHAAASMISKRGLVRPFDVKLFQTSMDPRCLSTRIIHPPHAHNPPAHLIIAFPSENGTYPVILFKHGFMLANCYYTEIFEALASAGYIVVAPQAITANSNCMAEIEETAKVANWVSKSLAAVLNAAVPSLEVVPNMSKLVMSGHSRGGKIAFAMVLGMASIEVPEFSALIALDPVDSREADTDVDVPAIVASGCNHSRIQMSVPALLLGAGYSSQGGFLGTPACAPACCSHMAYFNCSSAPIMYQFVASQYGHLDFLDDLLLPTSWLCKSGGSKALLRDFSTNLIGAFLDSALEGNKERLDGMVKDWEAASIMLEEPQFYNAEDKAAIMDVEREDIFEAML